MSTKLLSPTAADQAFHDDMMKMFRKHLRPNTKERLLALASQVVGEVLAHQDQRKWTPAQCIEMIQANIEKGNADEVARLMKLDGKQPPFIN